MATNIGTLEAILQLKDNMSPTLASAAKGLLSATAGFLTLGAAVAGASKALEAQGEAEAAVNSLNLALANTGQYSAEASAGLREFASQMQDTTAFGDEAVLNVEALFASFGMAAETIPQVTKVTADFAAATGKDLATAAQLVSKAFVGNTAMLSRYGIVVDENIPKSQQFSAVLEQLNARFGGSAQTQVLSYGGAMEQLKNQMGEVWEAAGRLLGSMLGVQDGVGGAIPMIKALVGAINSMQIAFAEAKALAFEFIGWLIDLSVTGFETGQKIREAFGFKRDPSVDALLATTKAISDGQRTLATETREASNKLIEQGGSYAKVTNSATPFTHALVSNADAVKKAREEYDKFIGSMEKSFDAAGKERTAFDERTAALDAYMATLGPSVDEATTKMERLADVTDKWGGVTELSNAQLVVLITKLREEIAVGGQSEAGFKKLGQAMDEAAKRGGKVAQSAGFAAEALKGLSEESKKAAEHHKKFVSSMEEGAKITGMVSQGLDAVGDVMQAFGVKADSAAGKAMTALSGLASTAQGVFSAMAKGDTFGAIMAGVTGLAKVLGGLFKNKAKEAKKEADKLTKAFIEAQGGADLLKEAAAKAGMTLDALFAAKNKDQAKAAIDALTEGLELHDQSIEKVNAAMEKYGLTIEQMGPKWQAQELNTKAMSLLEDYRLLTAAGADQATVITAMGPALAEYVNQARTTGTAIPEAMRPIVDQLISQGLLLDANGNAFKSSEEAGLSFSETLEQGLSRTIEAINKLVAALLGIPSEIPVNVPVHVNYPNGPPPGDFSKGEAPPVEGFAGGTGGFRDFGAGTPAMLHGVEAVVTPSQASGMSGGGGGFNQQSFDAAVQRQTTAIVHAVRDAVLLARR